MPKENKSKETEELFEDEPSQPDTKQSSSKKDKSKKVWIWLFVISLLALVGLGIYGYITITNDNKTIKDQQSQINELQSSKKAIEDKTKTLEEASSEASKAAAGTKTFTDQEKIAAALKAECASRANEYYEGSNNGVIDVEDLKSYRIDIISGNFAEAAYLCKTANEGPSVILVKVNDNWNVVASGLGQIVNNDIRKLYGIPSNIPLSGVKP